MRNETTNLERSATGTGGVFYGVYPAKVVTTDRAKDGDGDAHARPGFVPVALPMFSGEPGLGAIWARVAVPMAGYKRGTYFMPEVDDEVLVAFEAGNVDRPYVVGALWNGVDEPPVKENNDNYNNNDDNNNGMDNGNNIRTIVSRSGLALRFDDTNGAESVSIKTPGGSAIVLDGDGSKIEVVDGSGNKVLIESGNVSIEVSGQATLTASTVEIEAAQLTVDAGMSYFTGVVKCDTLITNSVISSSYTRGPGNRI